MALRIPDRLSLENFTIENNILKGIEVEIEENIFVGDAILQSLDSAPNHVAQIDAENDNTTTFSEMKDRSIRCALWMREYGVKPGDIIIICSDNHLNIYVPFFATFYVGATFNGWDHEISLKTARQLMHNLKPKLIFVCEYAVEVILEAAKLENVNVGVIVFGEHPNVKSLESIIQIQSEDEVRMFRPLKINNPDAVSIILLTSGSTGPPKAVMHSYKNVLILVQTFSLYPYKGITLCTSTVYWLTGVMYLIITTITQATRIILKKSDIEDCCKAIQKYKVQRLFLSPLAINYLCKLKAFNKYNLDSIEVVLTGGVKINQQMLKEFKRQLPRALVYQIYALSETARVVISQTENTKNIDSAGFVASNTQIKIVNADNHKILGFNQEGEIYVKQPTLMLGYYKNLEETKNTIDEDGWLHTGDKGYFNENGEIIITGRLKDVIKCRGYQISPAELEEVLSSHPAVLEVAVVPIPHEMDTEQPLAFVKANVQVSEEELVAMSLVLGENKKLRGGVKFIQEIPKTPTGKVNKTVLKEMAKALQQQRLLRGQ